jgi:hypothetical protein
MNKTKFNIKIKGDPFLRKYHVKDYEVREYNTQLYINHKSIIYINNITLMIVIKSYNN